ncbi:hypothetical protein LTR10_016480 [Elasticomyces elasticus]|uniref:OPA3-like protein n=1 Tax=Exophiala sideris TaxID=1016849 RepID=A0ABR0JKH9_9EURO|nr:hypothetical protein LTR10_016480 [Elasticomyces elasticus]KAK5032125.1 hypothetical protein LTR13_007342 [Exophiala sideris]KAK5036123.1 hypothetical protein LTS07_001848 [Exophiala sideris]KAK5066505.1 hypothetical protein LTR69_001851 [Exophiala sideris]KAK5180327.1 hypothetical protein LTR44_007084 [Eurotiomycetes sp. CCFEE 6388]
MSLTLKFTSLAVRTLAKPIGNLIKRQAREHEGFRRTCISMAQTLHRVDMRWRIGLLQDAAAVEKQAAKEAAAEAAKKNKANIATVKTEAQTKAEEEAAAKAAKEASEPPKPRTKPKIRPLSEAKAIESGATFISETFLFTVAAGLIVFESWRSGRKESRRRDDVADRLSELEESEKAARKALVELEREVLRLRAKEKNGKPNGVVRILPPEIYEEDKDVEKSEKPKGWFARIASFVSSEKDDEEAKEALEQHKPGPAEKILVETEKALEEKHKQQAIEAAKEATSESKSKR